jgi:hypothetical protein
MWDEELPGTSIAATVGEMKRNISRQLRSVLRAIKKLDAKNPLNDIKPENLENEWILCHALVMSRSGVFSDREASDWTKQPISVVPYIDFVNHSGDPNACLRIKADGSVSLVATRDISTGEEVTITYWTKEEPLTSEQSLFTFGFLSENNKFAIPGISFTQVDTDKKRAIQRLLFIDGRPNQAHEHIYSDDLPSAIRYFSVEAMDNKEVDMFIKAYVTENGLGQHAAGILKSFEDIGKLKLASHLHQWRSMLEKSAPKNLIIREYRDRILDAIDNALGSL